MATTETNNGLKDIISPTIGKYEVRYVYVIDQNTLEVVDVRAEYVLS